MDEKCEHAPSTLLNFDEAQQRLLKIEDHVSQELAALCFGVVVKKWIASDRPIGAFDLLFFVRSLEAAFADRDLIARVLQGGSLRWPELD